MANIEVCVMSFYLLLCLMKLVEAQTVPAVFVFGDSLVDVGNNNYLKLSFAKADFPHNGLDFPTGKPTGRFSNGKNAADLLAEKLGMPTSPPPYLSLKSKSNATTFVGGVSFASGGAGIFDGTDATLHQSIPLTKQVEFYSTAQKAIVQKLGSGEANKYLSKSIYVIVIGSNDIFGYFGSSASDHNNTTPQQYVNSMIVALKSHLKRIHDLGGRKFVTIGVGPVGCVPAQRNKNETQDCNEEANYWATNYNQGLQLMLKDLKSELNDLSYSFVDTYALTLDFIQNPSIYGFKEVKSACCGLGNLNADIPCIPISTFCSNRSDHVFWDLYHPTEAAATILVNHLFDGSQKYALPLNVKQLVAV